MVRKDKRRFQRGELVKVQDPFNKKKELICVVVSTKIPSHYKTNEFFIVYSVQGKEKFITTRKFMTKMS